MAKFSQGDKVLVNGNLVAEIHTYDEDKNRLVYVVRQGGSTNRVYGHISNTRVEHLASGPVAASEPVEAPEGADTDYDDYLTADSEDND